MAGHSPGGLLLHLRSKAKPSEDDRGPRSEDIQEPSYNNSQERKGELEERGAFTYRAGALSASISSSFA